MNVHTLDIAGTQYPFEDTQERARLTTLESYPTTPINTGATFIDGRPIYMYCIQKTVNDYSATIATLAQDAEIIKVEGSGVAKQGNRITFPFKASSNDALGFVVGSANVCSFRCNALYHQNINPTNVLAKIYYVRNS